MTSGEQTRVQRLRPSTPGATRYGWGMPGRSAFGIRDMYGCPYGKRQVYMVKRFTLKGLTAHLASVYGIPSSKSRQFIKGMQADWREAMLAGDAMTICHVANEMMAL